MEECTHKIGWFSTRFTYPPIIGKMSTCWRCGHTKAGSNTITFAANHIDMTHASAPSDPSAGSVRVFSTGTTNLTISNTDADDHTFGGGGTSVVTIEGSNTTEASTTSTSDADMSNVGSLDIAAGKFVDVRHMARGVKGGESVVQAVGLEVNGTLIMSTRTFSYGTSDSSGIVYYTIGQRQTNYINSISGHIFAKGYANSGSKVDSQELTTDAITSITVKGKTAAGTLYSDEVYVYSMATS